MHASDLLERFSLKKFFGSIKKRSVVTEAVGEHSDYMNIQIPFGSAGNGIIHENKDKKRYAHL